MIDDEKVKPQTITGILIIFLLVCCLFMAGYAWFLEQKYVKCAVKFNNCSSVLTHNCVRIEDSAKIGWDNSVNTGIEWGFGNESLEK